MRARRGAGEEMDKRVCRVDCRCALAARSRKALRYRGKRGRVQQALAVPFVHLGLPFLVQSALVESSASRSA